MLEHCRGLQVVLAPAGNIPCKRRCSLSARRSFWTFALPRLANTKALGFLLRASSADSCRSFLGAKSDASFVVAAVLDFFFFFPPFFPLDLPPAMVENYQIRQCRRQNCKPLPTLPAIGLKRFGSDRQSRQSHILEAKCRFACKAYSPRNSLAASTDANCVRTCPLSEVCNLRRRDGIYHLNNLLTAKILWIQSYAHALLRVLPKR